MTPSAGHFDPAAESRPSSANRARPPHSSTAAEFAPSEPPLNHAARPGLPHSGLIPAGYPKIFGPRRECLGQPCLAFEKYDGSNLRFLWHIDRGWYAASTRAREITPHSPIFGPALAVFQSQFAELLEARLRTASTLCGPSTAVAYCEWHGALTFAGVHREHDPKSLTLFDVYLPEHGFVPPTEFATLFASPWTARVVYEGPFTSAFIDAVQASRYSVREGVVAKGIHPQHDHDRSTDTNATKTQSIWMAKVKTKAWLEEQHRRQPLIEPPDNPASRPASGFPHESW